MNEISLYTSRTYTAGASSVFSSHLSNEFRLNYSSNETSGSYVIDAFGGNTPVNLPQLLAVGTTANVGINLSYSGYNTSVQQFQQSAAQRQWNFVDTVSYSFGRHQVKFGMDFRRLAPFAVQPTPEIPYYYGSIDGEKDVEMNDALTNVQAYAPAYPLYKNFSAFGQDEWKVSERLTLSFGLRWEVNPAPGVTQGLKPYTVQGSSPSTWALAPEGTPLWQTTWYNFAPRLGAAYVLRNASGWEEVVRGGGGVLLDTGQQLGAVGFNGPGFLATTQYQVAPFPSPVVVPIIVNPPVAGSYSTNPYGFAAHLQLPYTLQWNASFEQGLGKSQALTVSYVGSHAARLLQENVFEPANNPNNPNGLFYFIENGLTSDYSSLQIQFRRRLSQGLTTLASYTWSHCIDYGSQDYFLSYQRGNCDFDVRHSLSAAFSYDLPNVGRGDFVDAALHHWGLDDRFTARTAFPVTLDGNGLLQPNGQFYYPGLDLIQGQPVYLYGSNCDTVFTELYGNTRPCPGGRAINPCAFVNVGSAPGAPCTAYGLDGTAGGLAPRNFARGFDAVQMDLGVRRDFPIHERLKLQFRAEAFNIFNHPNLGTIYPYLGANTFGQATATLASSLGVLSPLYQMGGPRSMQFAFKLTF